MTRAIWHGVVCAESDACKIVEARLYAVNIEHCQQIDKARGEVFSATHPMTSTIESYGA